jgi:hypothetical protein
MRPAMRGEPAARFQPPGWLARATSATGPQVTYAGRSLARRPLLTAATVRGAYLQSCGPQALGHRRRRPWRPVRTPYFALDGSGSSCGNAGRHSGEPVPTRTEEVRGSNPLTSTPTKTQVTGLAGSPPPGRRRSRPRGRAANGQQPRRCVAVLRMVGVEGRASGEASSVMARPGIGVGCGASEIWIVGSRSRRLLKAESWLGAPGRSDRHQSECLARRRTVRQGDPSKPRERQHGAAGTRAGFISALTTGSCAAGRPQRQRRRDDRRGTVYMGGCPVR